MGNRNRNRRIIVNIETIHISEDEAARDFAGLMARVRAGAEVVIENANSPAVVLRAAEQPRGRLLSESIALAEDHARELGYEPVMDAEFAADMEEIIANRKPRDTSAWD
jgi:antitoxin (DNA-binding transcriptional repressor) of toxin-antitoxin stability system